MSVPALSLFTGAGGFDLGAIAAGCEPRVCIEMDATCAQTLALNPMFGRADIVESDIRLVGSKALMERLGFAKGELPLLIGGPPCQSFSKAGYWTSTGDEAARRRKKYGYRTRAPRRTGSERDTKSDPRTDLVFEYLRILQQVRPISFVFENVLSILHPTNKEVLNSFTTRCKRLGYQVNLLRANAAAYGVAQNRERIFVIGLPKGAVFVPPTVTHSSGRHSVATNVAHLKPAVGVGSVIRAFSGRRYMEPEETVMGRWAKHLTEIPPGWNYKALTAWAGHPKPSFEAETRFWNFLLKLDPARPAWTIAANPGPWVGPFHWANRRLRVPELAAIQDFPEGYRFAGTRRQIQRQIGNAVPPRLAQAVVSSVLSSLKYRSHG